MGSVSEKYLKKGSKLYEIMQKELVDRISDFEEIKDSLVYLERDLKDLEESFRNAGKLEEFSRKIKTFEEHIEMLHNLRQYIKINHANFNEALEKGKFSKKEMSIEELQELQDQSQYFINELAGTLDALKPIKKDVDSISENSKKQTGRSLDVMESIYRHSSDCKTRIEQNTELISKNVNRGNLHDIFMADSLMKADIELLKKEGNKR